MTNLYALLMAIAGAAVAAQIGINAQLRTAAGILGQLLAALAIDHYGWFGAPVQRLSVVRVIGAVLLTVGAVLVRWR